MILTRSEIPPRAEGGAVAAARHAVGLLVFLLLLAWLATVPIAGLVTLGYLLGASATVARDLGAARALASRASRVGRLALGVWLVLLPARAAAQLAARAVVIRDGASAGLYTALLLASAIVSLQIAGALLAGGGLRDFLRPHPVLVLRAMTTPAATWTRARDALFDLLAPLRLPHHLWLGARGAVGTLVWLAPPVTMLVVAGRSATPWLAILGGVALVLVVMILPLAQTHFAREERLGAMFDLVAVRRLTQRAPIASALGVIVTLVLAAPLFLLRIELLPRVLWSPVGALFVAFALPGRLVLGWAYARAIRSDAASHVALRLLGHAVTLPFVVGYVTLLYLTQYTSWSGAFSLYDQHAFLVPAPFLPSMP